jgi:DNA-binding response OmpR family regulator
MQELSDEHTLGFPRKYKNLASRRSIYSEQRRMNLMEDILVIEDTPEMQKALQRLFAAEGLGVRIAADGLAALQAFRAQQPTAVILDLKLPGMPGRELCREFKASAPSVPVIVVSANAEVDDKVLLLELGADDYVTKPFSPKELLARVRRTMRRAQQAPDKASSDNALFQFGEVTVRIESMEVTRRGEPVALTAQEFRLLKYFLERPGKVVSRDELLNVVWGYQNYPSTRTVDNHILRLRQKLENDHSNPRHFLTLHGTGYKFVPAASVR